MRSIAVDPVVQLKTVGLALTLQCNFHCSHCITESSPQETDKMDIDVKIVLEDSSLENICFTGGESLLCEEMLIDCISEARSKGLIVSLVTNGFWAKDEVSVKSILKKLSHSGVSGVCISLDQFHLPFVEFENAIRVARTASEFGINHLIRVCATKNDKFAEYLIDKNRFPEINFQRVRVLRMGRAKKLPNSCFNFTRELPEGCCTTVRSPIVLPNGLVQACCGPGINFKSRNPLNLGNWKEEELGTILRRSRTSPLVMFLYSLGPKLLYDSLMNYDVEASIKCRAKYSGICELCVDICNNTDILKTMESMFLHQEMKQKLIASQIYQQSHMFLKKQDYLDLPG